MSDMYITVIYHTMSLSVLYVNDFTCHSLVQFSVYEL